MSLDPAPVAGLGPVRVVGTGLLGTSIALGLRGMGVRVLLSDPSPTALALARDVGGGELDPGTEPVALVVVGAPPDVTAAVVAAELARHPEATVTDVASVKSGIWTALRASGADLSRYVGGHPMAGRERSGPVAARADLFLGRPWVICPGGAGSGPDAVAGAAGASAGFDAGLGGSGADASGSGAGAGGFGAADPERVNLVRRLALALGATPVLMPAAEHDEAVALISHVPQLAASLVAARLVKGSDPAVGLAGQGLRDVTRIADSDPALWAQILAANAAPVSRVLRDIRDDLDGLIVALDALAASGQEQESGQDRARTSSLNLVGPGTAGDGVAGAGAVGARAAVARVVEQGRAGRERIPGKHGDPVTRYAVVTALLPDEPGQLARLFDDIGAAGVNVEEFGLEHAPGQKVGLAGVSVLPPARAALEKALVERGWHVVA